MQEERFQQLIEQIGLADEGLSAFFERGRILKVMIDRENRSWHFSFHLRKPLPVDIYQLFQNHLQQSFQHIAQIRFSIRYEEAKLTDDLLRQYWKLCIAHLEGFAEPLLAYISEQRPVLDGNRLILKVRNETEAAFIKRNLERKIVACFTSFGFSPFSILPKVTDQNGEYHQFYERKKLEDNEKIRQSIIEKREKEKKQSQNKQGSLLIGQLIKDEPIPIETIQEEERRVTLQGTVFHVETKALRSGRTLLLFKMTDYTDSIAVKMFAKQIDELENVKKGMWVKVRGSIQTDTYMRELVMIARDVNEISPKRRHDTALDGKKRVELHLHTPMSQMDAVTSTEKLVEQAKLWGHEAIAITDHAVVQSFPDAYAAGKKHGVKILYGVEANLIDDGVPIAYNEADRHLLHDTYVVFDVETTGLSAVYHKIIELAAVKIKNGKIVDRFERFANPHERLSATTIELTGITDDMVENAPEIEEVLNDFKEFIEDHTLVAHNASFDIGFLNVGFRNIALGSVKNPVIDTLELARFLYPELKNHRLDTLCNHFSIELTQHHRAIYDAEATGFLLWKLVEDCNERGITNHDQLNQYAGTGNYKRTRPFHCTIIAKNSEGLKNLYKLISFSHIETFYRTARIPRSKLEQYRDGLIVGSGCDKGEVFEAMMQKSIDEVEEIASFYDYLEVQPPSNYSHLLENGLIEDEATLHDILRNIVALGDKLNIPVVATGNVHYLNPEDAIYRKVLIASQGGANPLNRQTLPDVHFRTTDEMLDCFSFLERERAEEIVVTNTQFIASIVDEIQPVPDELYTPKIDGAEEEIRTMCYRKANEIYGDPLPKLVEDRLEKELDSIIRHGFAVIYLISHKLVKKSLNDGYLVGSRGSVGSSFVATMTEITEVNPLPPHYICPECKHSVFFDDGSVGSGFDLPDQPCEKCGVMYKKDGQDIPFETFLGFKGDKVPDIDLNFSGEYQARAHNYTKELFGEEYVYRAGTIGTVADKTAYGFVKGYENDNDLHLKSAEIDRLVAGCTGVKRTTGQHPGGIIVVPDDMDIYDFCPIQYPADDKKSEWKTTHFDFNSIHDNLLKLDILGHDDPTVIRMLEDLSGIDPKTIPTDDPEVMKLFSGTESIGVTSEQIMCKTGTLGIPEFGTRFVRQMLEETKPKTFSELVQISGLSHGTDVWLNNASELIANGTCELKDVIGCRDDIMVYLIYKGLDPALAFQIMEFVRKGKGLKEEWIAEMKKHEVPDWYIDSCQKIKYMFPKAHAAAYVLMAVRIAYFKVHYPIFFYAAYFTVRADDFDIDAMVKGSNAIRAKIEAIHEKGFDATAKEKSLVTVLELALEMCERGMSFQPVDLYRSHATRFIVDGNTLLPPFNALPGVGTNAAVNIMKARDEGEFLSKEDLQKRSKITKTVLEYLDQHGCLDGMPEQNQLSLF